MADPTLVLDFDDFRIRVAEFLGIAYYGSNGRGAAQLPIDTHDLDLVGRLVNDGYRKFVTENPKWLFLTPLFNLSLAPTTASGTTTSAGTTTTAVDTALTYTFTTGDVIRFTSGAANGLYATISGYNSGTHTITFGTIAVAPGTGATYEIAPVQCVNGDASRYYMPDGFYGSLIDPLTYSSNSGNSPISEVNEEAIRANQSEALTTGTPIYVALRPLPTTPTTTSKRWEAIFWPTPGQAYVVTGRCRVFPDQLVNSTDRTIAGFQHDTAILAAALAEAEMQRGDRQGYQASRYAQELAKSIKLDREAAPKRRGYIMEGSDDQAVGPTRTWFSGVDTYNGNAV